MKKVPEPIKVKEESKGKKELKEEKKPDKKIEGTGTSIISRPF